MTAQIMKQRTEGLDCPTSSSMAEFLSLIRIELDALTAIVGAMQAGLSPVLLDAATRHPETYRCAQNLDLMWQTLDNLTQVVDAVSRQAQSCGPIDLEAVLADVTLLDVATRLRGLATQARDNDLDLF